jgi:hypothetical protein
MKRAVFIGIGWALLLGLAWLAAVLIRADWDATQLIWDGTYEGLYD